MSLAINKFIFESNRSINQRNIPYAIGFSLGTVATVVMGVTAAIFTAAAVEIVAPCSKSRQRNVLVKDVTERVLASIALKGLAFVAFTTIIIKGEERLQADDLSGQSQFDRGTLDGIKTTSQILVGPARVCRSRLSRLW